MQWLESLHNERLRLLKITLKEFLQKFTDKQLDELAIKDLSDSLTQSLYELKSIIQHDLEIDRFESDAVFWKFVGNPIYRMHERGLAEKCRDSDMYKKMLFEKNDLLINELRSDKELLKRRNAFKK
jgi:hypothetical protein